MIQYPANGMTWTANVTKMHDGDTVTLDIDLNKAIRGIDRTLGFHIYIVGGRLRFHNATRLYGINAPELSTVEGKASRDALAHQLPLGSTVTLTTWLDASDKYGRLLGRIEYQSVDLNQWMVDTGHAVVWYGQGPKPA